MRRPIGHAASTSSWRALAALLLVGGGCGLFTLYTGARFIPIKVENAQFMDCVIEEQMFARHDPRRDASTIRDNLWECATQLGLSDYFEKNDIRVDKTKDRIRVQLYYERDVDGFFGYTYPWRFDHDETRALY